MMYSGMMIKVHLQNLRFRSQIQVAKSNLSFGLRGRSERQDWWRKAATSAESRMVWVWRVIEGSCARFHGTKDYPSRTFITKMVKASILHSPQLVGKLSVLLKEFFFFF